jgi:K+-transporting ATPase ATPase C chain
MLWASGSGLDPHISLESAKFQASRVAEARNMTIKELDDLIEGLAEDRFLGFMGQPRVNVLKLNRIIDNKR